MATKRKRNAIVPSKADPELAKQLQLLHVCGYCSKLVGDNESFHSDHAKSHEKEITQCRSCCVPVKLHEVKKHLDQTHPISRQSIRFHLDESLIELRIVAGKGFSSFWGLCLPASDLTLAHFHTFVPKWWGRWKNARTLGVFLIRGSKLHWRCSMCGSRSLMIFDETISMRAYALSHLEHFHKEEILLNVPGFFEFEWSNLREECDFDVKALMLIAQQRLKVFNRSYRTFYTINLSLLENGKQFLDLLKRRNCIEGGEELRYCIVCCSLVTVGSIPNHFRAASHILLKPVSESTTFTQVERNSEKKEEQIVADEPEPVRTEEEQNFKFPEELFFYSKEFLTLHRDEFKWRCCLCPHAYALPFATFIILRMYALRHIEEHHSFLFTKDFLTFEWKSLCREMQASFDICSFSPLQYTLKGEKTFNQRDPNDYMLPQQYYFLPKEYVKDTVICGFCYRSFNRINFLLHIAVHGFVADGSDTLDLRPIVCNPVVREMMGKHNYVYDGSCDDEPHTILTVDGKRLKAKMDLMNSQKMTSNPYFSEFSTPYKSERDTDCDQTPRSRRSAMDAKKILTETFKILKENVRSRRDTWNRSSSSSSGEDDDSEDERLEQKLEKESARVSSQRSETPKLERPRSRQARNMDLDKMKPAEIREWIREEANKKGVAWNGDSSDSSSDDSDSEADGTSSNGWSRMKLQDIKEVIRQAAKRKKIALSSDSSDDCDE